MTWARYHQLKEYLAKWKGQLKQIYDSNDPSQGDRAAELRERVTDLDEEIEQLVKEMEKHRIPQDTKANTGPYEPSAVDEQ